MTTAIDQYKQINVQSSVDDANAHKLIAMLMDGALEKIAAAKLFMQQNKTSEKGANISFAITIIDGLQASLDLEEGGEIANNLFRLYQYLMEILVQANLKDDMQQLHEAAMIMSTIKEGWDGIESQAKEFLATKK